MNGYDHGGVASPPGPAGGTESVATSGRAGTGGESRAGAVRPSVTRTRRVALLAAVLVLASTGAGVAALSNRAFEGHPALADEELGGVRGGFKLAHLGLSFSFGARVETTVTAPDLPQLALKMDLTFDNPKIASVVTTHSVDGVPEPTTTQTVDLTRQNIEVAVGDPGTTQVIHQIGRNSFATVMRNLAQGADVNSNTVVDVTVDGLPNLQSRIPSRGITSTMDTMRHALIRSLQ